MTREKNDSDNFQFVTQSKTGKEQALSSCSLLHLSADYNDKMDLNQIVKQPIKDYNEFIINRQVVAG